VTLEKHEGFDAVRALLERLVMALIGIDASLLAPAQAPMTKAAE
jgi:hypothetical protein